MRRAQTTKDGPRRAYVTWAIVGPHGEAVGAYLEGECAGCTTQGDTIELCPAHAQAVAEAIELDWRAAHDEWAGQLR